MVEATVLVPICCLDQVCFEDMSEHNKQFQFSIRLIVPICWRVCSCPDRAHACRHHDVVGCLQAIKERHATMQGCCMQAVQCIRPDAMQQAALNQYHLQYRPSPVSVTMDSLARL